MATGIPIIDVEPLVRRAGETNLAVYDDVGKVVKDIDHACREIGFFYARGHGVPPEFLEVVRTLSREFFDLDESDKLKIKMSSASGYRGYQIIGENVSKGLRDAHEAIDYFRELGPDCEQLELAKPIMGKNQWPERPERFQSVIEEYIDKMQKLSKAILAGIALALGGEADTFGGEKAGNPFWILRVIGYPPSTCLKTGDDFGVGCGEHTDYGLLTLVNQDPDVSALQVKNKAGNWIWANPIPGTLVVNIGDMLKIWSNGIYQPTLHRVLNNHTTYRVSVPFFYEPNFDARVEPLHVCGGDPVFDPVLYGQHLVNKVVSNFG